MPNFEIFKGSQERYYWRLVGGNGEIVAQSEGYANRSNAKRAIAQVKQMIADAEIVSEPIKEESPE